MVPFHLFSCIHHIHHSYLVEGIQDDHCHALGTKSKTVVGPSDMVSILVSALLGEPNPSPRRSAATLAMKEVEVEEKMDDPASSIAGPSRLPLEGIRSKVTLDPSFFTSTRVSRSSHNEVETIDALAAHLYQPRDALEKNQAFPSISRAEITWRLYNRLSEAARPHLPPDVLRLVLREIIPRGFEPSQRITRSKVNERSALRYQARLQTVIQDISASSTQLDVSDYAVALRSLARYGHVESVERVYGSLTRLLPNLDAVQKDQLAINRLIAITNWAKQMIVISDTPRGKETFYRQVLENDEFPSMSDRQKALQPSQERPVGALWSVLNGYTDGSTTPTTESVRYMTSCLNLVRELYPERDFAASLDAMLEQTLKLAYRVDTTYLQKRNTSSLFGLKNLRTEGVLALVQWLARRGDTWRMMAVVEACDSRKWYQLYVQRLQVLLEDEVEKVVPPPVPVESDFGPTLTSETAAFQAERSEVDAFGRVKKPSLLREAMSNDPVELDEDLVPHPHPLHRARRYADFYPATAPSPLQVVEDATAEFDQIPAEQAGRVPTAKKTGVYRYTMTTTYKAMLEHGQKVGDLGATMHILRMYLDAAAHQQAYFIRKIEISRRRQEHLGPVLAQKEAEGKRPSARNSLDPWTINPPSVRFSTRLMLIPLVVARQSKDARETFEAYTQLVRDAARRLREEHVYLSGREPSRLFQLERSAYVDTMRQRGQGDNAAPMARYFFQHASGKIDPIEYLWQLDRRYSRLLDILSGLERQKTAARMTRLRRNKVYKLHKKQVELVREEEDARLAEEKQRREEQIRLARAG